MHLISSEPYLDQKNECYKNIITVSPKPTGSLLSISKLIKPPKLSPFIEKIGVVIHLPVSMQLCPFLTHRN